MMKKFKEVLGGFTLIATIISIMIFGAACKEKEMEEIQKIQKPTTEVTEHVFVENIITENVIVETTTVECTEVFGEYKPITGESLSGKTDFDKVQEEINNNLDKQDNNFCKVE